MINLAIDAMGGDNAPRIVCEAINKFFSNSKTNTQITLFGDEKRINEFLQPNKNITIIHTPDFVPMDEKNPLAVLDKNKNSSMVLALNYVKEGKADAFLTAGPTGPFVAASQLILKRIPEIKKPALCVTTKNVRGEKIILMDAGANIDVSPIHLSLYAKSGQIYAKTALEISNPKVGLFSNGVEEGKGRSLEQETFKLLKNDESVNFHGYIEPSELLTTECSVLISDGFTANAIMKSAEGTLKTFASNFKKEISSSFSSKIGYLFMKKSIKRAFGKFDQSGVGAAILLGVNSPSLKAHGSSTAEEFLSGIYQAEKTVKANVVSSIITAVKNVE